ncbi:MAG: acylphosphatase [Candidatus Marinimicrobia bacterium]|nr:acylphosphatase [Candidatus Neomarinimicrobiota bacterium]MCH8304026.1 acylphosphatase [Candidatus Neomarinimicrobiota bacterium]
MNSSGINVIVSGVVQMVGYRWFAVNSAKELHLTGWVKNLENGTVELRAFGQKGTLDAFIKQLSIGPMLSKVTNVNVQGIEYESAYKDFMVR